MRLIFLYLLLVLSTCEVFSQDFKNQEKILKLITKKKFGQLHRQFDQNMSQSLSKKQIKKIWNTLEKQLGHYKSFGETERVLVNDRPFYITPIYFKSGSLDLKTSFNDKNKLESIFFMPKSYSTPRYGLNLVYNKVNINIESGKYSLPGELLIPKGSNGKTPLVIFVHGSGPNDRYESGTSVRVFKDMLQGLLTKNIACLVYDKRTLIYEKEYDTAQYTIWDETVEDAINAFNLAKRRNDIDTSKIFIAGHSQGGYALPLILKNCKGVKGGISLAGCSRPLEDVLLDQFNYLTSYDGKVSFSEKLFLKKAKKKIKYVKSDDFMNSKPSLKILAYWPSAFWKDIRTYSPVEELSKINVPVLFMQGERDYQVTLKDLNHWKEGQLQQNNWVYKTYPKINHLFIEGEGKPNPIEYFSGGNVPLYIIEDMANWVNQ